MSELEDIVEHMRRFAWPDYLVFVLMLFLCIMIGVYFGFVQRKPNTESEYLMGGRTMLVFPIALSLIARFGYFVIYTLPVWGFPHFLELGNLDFRKGHIFLGSLSIL